MKTLVTIMALCLTMAFSAQAQVNKKVEKRATQSTEVQPQQDLGKQVKAHTDRMTKDLGLSAEQAEKVMSENKTMYSNMQSMTTEEINSKDREKMSDRTMENYNAKLESILDETQYRKYQSMQAEYMKGFNSSKVSEVKKTNDMDYE